MILFTAKVRDGDILVFGTEGFISAEAQNGFAESIKQYFAKFGFKDVGCVFLEKGVELKGVIRRE